MIHVGRAGLRWTLVSAPAGTPISSIICVPRAYRNRGTHLNPADVKRLIEQGLPSAEVEVQSPDNTHFEALVVSAEFEGKRSLVRHQMVYATLGASMGREIHALSLRTLTPQERRDS